MKNLISAYKNTNPVKKFSIWALIIMVTLLVTLYSIADKTEYRYASVLSGCMIVEKEMRPTPLGNSQEFGTILIVDEETGAATLAYFPTERDFMGCTLLTRRDKKEYAEKELRVEYYEEDGNKFVVMASEK